MATAFQERINVRLDQGCLGKADPSEPVFILRAQDKFAAETIRFWARCVERELGRLCPKTIEAREIADQMDQWYTHKVPD